jgi:mycofactocin precursor
LARYGGISGRSVQELLNRTTCDPQSGATQTHQKEVTDLGIVQGHPPDEGYGHSKIDETATQRPKEYTHMQMEEKDPRQSLETKKEKEPTSKQPPEPAILEEITIEELAVDGICGIY